jgi:hypothetical protein
VLDFGRDQVLVVGDATITNGMCYKFNIRSAMNGSCILPPFPSDEIHNPPPRESFEQVGQLSLNWGLISQNIRLKLQLPVCADQWVSLCASSCWDLQAKVLDLQLTCEDAILADSGGLLASTVAEKKFARNRCPQSIFVRQPFEETLPPPKKKFIFFTISIWQFLEIVCKGRSSACCPQSHGSRFLAWCSWENVAIFGIECLASS